MPATNETTAVVAEPASEPAKDVESNTKAEEKTKVAEKVEEADKTGAGDAENGEKKDEEAKNGGEKQTESSGEGEKSAENGGEGENGKSEEAANGEKVKTPSKEDYETGASLLAQGKRHLYVKDYPSAVAALSEACAKISAEHGQMADECADGYYYYGSALLELAREEMAVLGEPEGENKEAGDEDDEEEEGEEEGEGAAEETLEASKIEEKGGEEESGEKSDEKMEKGGDETKEEVKEGEEGKEGDEPKEEGEDENVNDLQLAWEMFDLARVIYERQNNEKKLADTYLKLGEVAMESENYDGAVQDMNKCLTLQHKMLSSDNRAIAETLFQLGVASSLCNQFDEAIKYFTNAGVVLERRIWHLKSTKTADPENLKKDPFYTVEKEIDELKVLLPEIKDKIADMEDFKREAMKALKESLGSQLGSKDGAGSSSSSAGGSSAAGASSSLAAENGGVSASPSKATGPVNDISHLVRKKRKADEVINEKETSEAKKPNVEKETSEAKKPSIETPST